MEIGQDPTGITGMGPSTNDATGSSALGKDEFVKLLMTQMQNQDPTSPQDSEAFVAQLAQFAQVELAQAQSARLEALLVAQAASNELGAAELVGKDVTLADDKIGVDGGKVSTSEVVLSTPARNVTVTIRDEAGKEVGQVQLKDQPAGPFSFTWDGETENGKALDGEYTLSVVATGDDGESVETSLLSRRRVEGVTYEDGVPMLVIGGRSVALSDVLGVHDPGVTPGEGAVWKPQPKAPPVSIVDMLNGNRGTPNSRETGELQEETYVPGEEEQLVEDMRASTHEIWMELSGMRREKGALK